MGKLALLLLLAASSAGLYHASSVADGVRGVSVQSSERHRLVLARAAAETGWARAKHALSLSFASATISGVNEGTPYTATATVTGERAVVVATGELAGTGGGKATAYRAVYVLQKNTSLNPRPRFLDYAFVADGDVHFGGNAKVIQPGVTDGSLDTLSIRVHTNGVLSRGGSAVVQGFGTYTKGAAAGIEGGFQPLYNPKNLPPVYQTPHVDIPVVDPSALAARDGVDYDYPGGVTLSGQTLPGGTRLRPKVYRIRGNATLSNLTVQGYAVFIVDGDVSASGTVRGQTAGYGGPQESALAIYTPRNVNLNGNTTVYAQILAGSDVSYTGNINLYGSLALRGTFKQGGTATIYYRPASPGLSQGFTGRPDPGFTLLAVREQ